MPVETIRDLLKWTQSQHEHLSTCARHCSDKTLSERAELLLTYLADHEKELAHVIARFDDTANTATLNTWVTQYFEKEPFDFPELCEEPFKDLDIPDIISLVMNVHKNIIELYKYLVSKAETESVRELLLQLQSLEEHEAMRMVQSSNRLQDM